MADAELPSSGSRETGEARGKGRASVWEFGSQRTDLGIFPLLFSLTFGIQFCGGLALYDLNPFRSTKNSFMAPNMVSLGKRFMCS